jgi:DNA invertase Pin-like site-specific DNA recombinase
MTNKKKEKAFVYLRTGYDNIEELKLQEKIVKEYCYKRNYKIEKIYFDLNINGNDSLKPALEELLSDIQGSDVWLVISKDITRLSENYCQLYDYVKYAEEIGFKIIETVENGIISIEDFDIQYYPFKKSSSI